MNSCLSIGNFAKLCHTTKDTLIHYDNIHLLIPAHTTASNHRVYHISQYYHFYTIQQLRKLGFTLPEIKKLFSAGSDSVLSAVFAKKENELKQQIKNLTSHLHLIEQKKYISSIAPQLTETPLLYYKTEPEYLYATRLSHLPVSQNELLTLSAKHIHACLENAVYPFPFGYVITKKSPILPNNRAFFVCSPFPNSTPDNRALVCPAGQYASILHKDSFDTISLSIKRITDFLSLHNYEIAGNMHITFHDTLISTDSPLGYLVEIPIR